MKMRLSGGAAGGRWSRLETWTASWRGQSSSRAAWGMAVWGLGGRLGLPECLGARKLLCPRFEAVAPRAWKTGTGEYHG